MTHPAGEHGHRGIIPHGADRFLAALPQRAKHLVALLVGDHEHLLVGSEFLILHQLERLTALVEQGGLDPKGIFPQPLLVGARALEAFINIRGFEQLPGLGINRQQLPRPDPTLGHHGGGIVIPDSDLGGHRDQAIVRLDPARWTQPVTVQHADGIATVRHDHTRRPIPGLHVHGVVLVEGAQVGVHAVDVLPGRRHHHAQGTENIHASRQKQFQHVIHSGGIGAGTVDQRLELFQIGQVRTAELGSPCHSPVAVALDGVDLAVVGEQPERLGQRPLGRSVGREPLVENAHGGGHVRITQIRIERRQVHRHHQSLVGQGPVGQTAHVELRIILQINLGPPAPDKQRDTKTLRIHGARSDEHLLDGRQLVQRHLPQALGIGRDGSPARNGQAFTLVEPLLQDGPCARGALRIPAQEDLADTVIRAQFGTQILFRHLAQKGIRPVKQQTTAIARFTVGGNAATVGHAGQRLDGRIQEPVAGLTLFVRNQAETAVIPVFTGLVQTCHHSSLSRRFF